MIFKTISRILFGKSNTYRIEFTPTELVNALREAGYEKAANLIETARTDIAENTDKIKSHVNNPTFEGIFEIYAATRRIVLDVIVMVEAYTLVVGGLTSQDKRSAAINYLDDLIVLPEFLEAFDDRFIGYLIDKGVSYLNRTENEHFLESFMENTKKFKKLLERTL